MWFLISPEGIFDQKTSRNLKKEKPLGCRILTHCHGAYAGEKLVLNAIALKPQFNVLR